MNGLKDAVLKMGEISGLIVDNNLVGSRLEKDSTENMAYHNVVTPQIENFRQQYNRKSPEKILEELLENFIERRKATEYYEAQSFRYFGRILHSYCWAAITLKDPNIKQLKVTYFPQLYVLVNRYGIRFGFAYGANVNPDSKFVETVKSDPKIGNQLLRLVSESANTKLYSEIGGEKAPDSGKILRIRGINDLNSKWSNKVTLVKSFSKPNIPDNLENEIVNTFDSVFRLFDSLSRGVPLDGEPSVQQVEGSEITDLLIDKKQIILYGPPGTGKTFKAQRFAVDFLSRRSQQEINMRVHSRQSSEGKKMRKTKGRM